MLALVVLMSHGAWAQFTTTMPAAPTTTTPRTAAPSTPAAVINQSQNPLFGGVPEEKVTPGVLKLSILDAIDRGLKHNLGLLLSEQQTEAARGAHWRELSNLLPNLSTAASESIEQINLAAFGIPAPGGMSPVIGPFDVFDGRVFLSQTIFNYEDLQRSHASAQEETAAKYTYRDTRELVVLVVGGTYLQAVADSSRVDATQAQFNAAQALYKQAVDMRNAGVVAGIDVLRSQVEMQAQQQRLLAAQNQFAKDKLTLARVIGLPVAQQFELSDKIPYSPMPPVSLLDAIQSAYRSRADYQAALARVVSARMNKRAAEAERLPTVSLNGDYGVIGPTPAGASSTYTLGAGIRFPIFAGGKAHGDILQADALLRNRQSEAADLRSRIEYEVRTAVMDLNTAAEQVQVAQQSVTLAQEQLKESRDRFAAGVTNNLEVVQSQEAVAVANENFIAALNAFNIAKLTLARDVGGAETETKKYLEGNTNWPNH